MNSTTDPSVQPHSGLLSSRTLSILADIYDNNSGAVTLYFACSSFADKAHREEVLAIEHLVNEAKERSLSGDPNPGLSKDLARILKNVPAMRNSPSRFRAIFACNHKQLWEEVDLPAREDISSLAVFQRFQLVPLLRVSQACAPYCVAIIERGKARAFTVVGLDIQEVDRLPSADLSVDAEDSRGGSSHHIDENVLDRSRKYFKDLALDLHEILRDAACPHLVIACRNNLWSELEPQLAKAGLMPMLAGRFRLSNFDSTPNEIIQAAKPVFAEAQKKYYDAFWATIRDDYTHSVVGIEPVLRALESGRVQTLFLGDISGQQVAQCSICQAWIDDGNTCPACGSAQIDTLPAEELLLRKALSTRANIIAPDFAMATLFGEVGAILRF